MRSSCPSHPFLHLFMSLALFCSYSTHAKARLSLGCRLLNYQTKARLSPQLHSFALILRTPKLSLSHTHTLCLFFPLPYTHTHIQAHTHTVNVWMYFCMCVCVCLCVCEHVFCVYVCVYVYICMYVCIHTCTQAHIQNTCMYERALKSMCTYI